MNNNMNIINMLNGLRKNPIQTLLSANLNVPQDIANDPQAIIQHLLNSGQISQSQINQAIQQSNNPMFRGLLGK